MNQPGEVGAGEAAPARGHPAVIALRGVHKRFGGVHALRGVDLDVEPGTVLALAGENGAGKSTLIKIMTGVHAPDEGDIALDGRVVERITPAGPERAASPRSPKSCPC